MYRQASPSSEQPENRGSPEQCTKHVNQSMHSAGLCVCDRWCMESQKKHRGNTEAYPGDSSYQLATEKQKGNNNIKDSQRQKTSQYFVLNISKTFHF